MCQLKWGQHLMREIKYIKGLAPMRRTGGIKAVAVPVPSSSVEGAEYRKQLAERYGFTQIGEPLPENVTLKDVMDTLPKKVLSFGHASEIS